MRILIQLLLTVALSYVVAFAGEHVQQPVAITTRPRFDDRGQVTYLLLSDNSHSYELSWGMPPKIRFVPVTLDTNSIYTFTVTERSYKGIAIPELRRVQQEGQTIYDVEVCEIHKTKMEHKKVRILYGLILPGPDEPTGDAEQQLFPHRREHSLGGCVVSSDSPKTEMIYICTECKKAYARWKVENKKIK
ncbi:MAG: hypothetical protein HYV35_03325 [Lentisphaerae bacterium]|nr:hypothetical protein [Lentisphaerota bacterium]